MIPTIVNPSFCCIFWEQNQSLMFQLPPEQGWIALEKARGVPVSLYPADHSVRESDTGKRGTVPVHWPN